MKQGEDDRIEKLFQRGRHFRFSKKTVIIGNNPVPDGVYLMESGFIKIYSLSNNGDEFLHIIYGPGEIFPLSWAFLGVHPELLFYETISTCVLRRVSKETFNHAIKTDSSFSYILCVRFAKHHRVLFDRIDNLEYKRAMERVAYYLLFLASHFGVKVNAGMLIDAPVTHELFANSINLTRESVSRQIEHLEKKQIIGKARKRLILLDIPMLKELTRPSNVNNWNL